MSRRGLRLKRRRGQAAIEMAIAVIASIVLMAGSVRIWMWMVQTMVERQEAYQASRRRAGRNSWAGCPKGYYTPGRVSVFGESNVPGVKSKCQ